MNASKFQLTLLLTALAASWLTAQELEVMYVERSHAMFQSGPNTVVPINDIYPGSWENFYFAAGAELGSGTLSNFKITGPSFPTGLPIPYGGDDEGYDLELAYSTASNLASSIASGTYTLSGTGNTVGSFSKSVFLDPYVPLTNLRLTNYSDLQSFDSSQPVTIAWQEFLQGQGDSGGLIEMEISYTDGWNEYYIWNSESITPPDALGLDASLTSVDIPAGVLNHSPTGIYNLSLFFIRIDLIEDFGAPFGESIFGSITSYELFTQIKASAQYHQDRLFLSPGNWIYDPRFGSVFGLSDDWGYSTGLGYVHVAWTPHWFYQINLGWLSVIGGDFASGMWLFSPTLGYLYVHESWPAGIYWSDSAQVYFNMIDPGV